MSFQAVGIEIEPEAMQEATSTCQAADSLIQQLLPAVMATLRHSEDEVAMAVVPSLIGWVARLRANQKRTNSVPQVFQKDQHCSCPIQTVSSRFVLLAIAAAHTWHSFYAPLVVPEALTHCMSYVEALGIHFHKSDLGNCTIACSAPFSTQRRL